MNKVWSVKGCQYFILSLLAISFSLTQLAMFLIKHNVTPTLVTTFCYLLFFFSTVSLGKLMRCHPLIYWGYQRQAMGVSFLITSVVIVLMTLCKWLVIQNTSHALFSPFIISHDAGELSYQKKLLFCVFYLFFSIPMQEIIFRTYVQPAIQNIIQGQGGEQISAFAWSNILTNLYFASIHLVRDAWLAFYSFVLGMVWGWVYQKYKSLPSILISHVLIAVWAFFILDIRGIFLMRL